jgi:hypothetical protein
MSKTLKKYAPFLRALHKATSDKARRSMLKDKMDNGFICCVSECAQNLLKGRVPLTSAQKKKLTRRKRSLRQLSAKKTSYKKKRHIIQTGGFIGALLTPIISILGGLLGGLGGRR